MRTDTDDYLRTLVAERLDRVLLQEKLPSVPTLIRGFMHEHADFCRTHGVTEAEAAAAIGEDLHARARALREYEPPR